MDQPAGRDLRPLRVGEMLDAAFRLLREQLGKFFVIALIFVAPVGIVLGLYQVSEIVFVGRNGILLVEDPDQYNLITVLLSLLWRLVELFGFAILVHLAAKTYLGEEYSVLRIFRASGRRLFAFFWMSILLLLYAFLVLILGGIVGAANEILGVVAILVILTFWSTTYSHTVPAFWAEELGPARSIGRSAELVKGRFWQVLAAILVAIVVTAVFTIGASAVALAAFTQSEPLWFVVLSLGGSAVGDMLGLMILAPIVTVAYYDGRVRKEGMDLELELGSEPDPPSSSDVRW